MVKKVYLGMTLNGECLMGNYPHFDGLWEKIGIVFTLNVGTTISSLNLMNQKALELIVD